jgi:hypothetical protein
MVIYMERSTAPGELPAIIEEHESLPPEGLPESEKIKSITGDATRLDLDYAFGSTTHRLWAVVGVQSCSKLVKNDQVMSIVQIAFIAPAVSIQYNDKSKEIEKIRPMKMF